MRKSESSKTIFPIKPEIKPNKINKIIYNKKIKEKQTEKQIKESNGKFKEIISEFYIKKILSLKENMEKIKKAIITNIKITRALSENKVFKNINNFNKENNIRDKDKDNYNKIIYKEYP